MKYKEEIRQTANFFLYMPCVLNKLRLSSYTRTTSGNPCGLSLSNLRYFSTNPKNYNEMKSFCCSLFFVQSIHFIKVHLCICGGIYHNTCVFTNHRFELVKADRVFAKAYFDCKARLVKLFYKPILVATKRRTAHGLRSNIT